eukprot:396739-Hanusia_phi.AAC.1
MSDTRGFPVNSLLRCSVDACWSGRTTESPAQCHPLLRPPARPARLRTNGAAANHKCWPQARGSIMKDSP